MTGAWSVASPSRAPPSAFGACRATAPSAGLPWLQHDLGNAHRPAVLADHRRRMPDPERFSELAFLVELEAPLLPRHRIDRRTVDEHDLGLNIRIARGPPRDLRRNVAYPGMDKGRMG